MNNSICFVNDYWLLDPSAPAITGPMVQLFLLGSALQKRGWQVDHVVTSPSESGTREVNGMHVHFLPHPRYSLWEIRGILRRTLCDIGAGFYYQRGRDPMTGIVAAAARSSGARFIWASAGEDGVERGKYVNRNRRRSPLRRLLQTPFAVWSDRITESGILAADLVFVQTPFQAGRLAEQFGRRDATVFGSGHAIPDEDAIWRKAEPPVILWIGSIKRDKRPEIFIEMARTWTGPEARFLMVGAITDQAYREPIERAGREIDRFDYRPQVPFLQTAELYDDVSLLVNTAKPGVEGLPNSFVQAWMSGVPALSLASDPRGLLTGEGLGEMAADEAELHAATARLLNDRDELRRIAMRARRYAVDHFSIDAVAEALEHILETSAAGRSATSNGLELVPGTAGAAR